MAYRRSAFRSRATPDYNDKTVLGIIQGMFASWNGGGGLGTGADDSLLMGVDAGATVSKLPGHALGMEVGARLRGIVLRGVVPGSQADEIGFLIRGTEQGLFEAGNNFVGEGVETLSLGMLNPGDAGGLEDDILGALGF